MLLELERGKEEIIVSRVELIGELYTLVLIKYCVRVQVRI